MVITMTKPGYTGIQRVFKAAGFSAQGIRAAWRHESAFRQEVVLATVLIPLAFFVGSTLTHAAFLIVVTLMVIVVELLNSSIEAVVDRIGPEHHALSGRAKYRIFILHQKK